MPIEDRMNNLLELMAQTQNFLSNGSGNLVVITMLIVVSLGLILNGHFRHKKVQKKMHDMENSLRFAKSSALGMGQQIISLEKQLQKLSVAPTKLDITNPTVSTKPLHEKTHIDQDDKYETAKKLLREGKAVGDVANTCQLSFAEVSLLQALSRSGKMSQPV